MSTSRVGFVITDGVKSYANKIRCYPPCGPKLRQLGKEAQSVSPHAPSLLASPAINPKQLLEYQYGHLNLSLGRSGTRKEDGQSFHT